MRRVVAKEISTDVFFRLILSSLLNTLAHPSTPGSSDTLRLLLPRAPTGSSALLLLVQLAGYHRQMVRPLTFQFFWTDVPPLSRQFLWALYKIIKMFCWAYFVRFKMSGGLNKMIIFFSFISPFPPYFMWEFQQTFGAVCTVRCFQGGDDWAVSQPQNDESLIKEYRIIYI